MEFDVAGIISECIGAALGIIVIREAYTFYHKMMEVGATMWKDIAVVMLLLGVFLLTSQIWYIIANSNIDNLRAYFALEMVGSICLILSAYYGMRLLTETAKKLEEVLL